MYGHRPPLRILGIGGLKSSQGRHAAIAFQYAKVGGDKRRLKYAVIARDGVEQRLELGQLFKHGGNLFLIGPGRQVVCEIGAMQTRVSGSSLSRLTSTSTRRTRNRTPFKGRVVIGLLRKK